MKQEEHFHVSTKFNLYKCLWQKEFHHFCHNRNNATEKVRAIEMLKWTWKPSGCAMQQFEVENFLNSYLSSDSHNLLFVGDSITQEHYVSLVCMLWDHLLRVEDSLTYQASSESFMEVHQLKTGAKIIFIRDDHLIERPEHDEYRASVPMFQSWQEVVLSLHPSCIIMNTGAHGTYNNTDMEDIASNVVSFLRQHFTGKFLYRETINGHDKCDQFDAPSSYAPKSHYNWGRFDRYNAIWRRHVMNESSKWAIIPAAPINARPDAHSIPPIDCLHTCLPGPMDLLNDFLYLALNTLGD